jgi:hypothetical protein
MSTLTERRKRARWGFGHTCECRHGPCRERLYFSEALYAEIKGEGTILTRTCASRERRVILVDYGSFVLCASTQATLIAGRRRASELGSRA